MRTMLVAALLGLAVAVAGCPGVVAADDGDITLGVSSALSVGEPFTVRFEVLAPDAATVELDVASGSWGSAEVLRVVAHDTNSEGVGTLHRFEVLLASFELGEAVFSPSVIVTDSDQVSRRTLEAVSVAVVSTLSADARLTLSGLPAPAAVDGGQSPFLVPGVIAAIVIGGAAVLVLLTLLIRSIMQSWALSEPEAAKVESVEEAEPLANAEGLLDADPIGAYRIIAQSVRRALTEAYQLPVASMTTDELFSRLEPGGVDSWVARMATDLLSQCDAVVYAGYLPASERRRGDLNVASEILRVAD